MFKYLFVLSLVFSSFLNAQSEPKPQQNIASWYQFTFENDILSIMDVSDDGYSNGGSIAWGRSNYSDFNSIEMPSWIRFLSDWDYINQGAAKQYSISYGVSQSIYTPTDLSQSALIEDDQPYAGTLLWHTKIRNYGDNRANSLGLDIGMVGPASLAEETQIFIHKKLDSEPPQGWDNQIRNELVFRIDAEHIERFYDYSLTDSLAFDTSSYSDVGVGNLRSDIGTGVVMRIGNMLDESYGSITPHTSRSNLPLTIVPDYKFYWQLFTSIYATYVFNDVAMNGNTFKDSHSVKLINEQIFVSGGIAALYHNWGVVFSFQHGTKEFEGQQNAGEYGSITISYQN